MARVPSRGSEQFVVRFPDGVRDRIREAAEANGRSMNAEIVAALEEKFPAPIGDIGGLSIDELIKRLETASPDDRERIKAALGVFG